MSKTSFRVLPHMPFKQLFDLPVSLRWTSNPFHGLPFLGHILALMPLVFRKEVRGKELFPNLVYGLFDGPDFERRNFPLL